MQLGVLYRQLVQSFKNAGIESPEQEARHILSRRAGSSWADIIARPECEIDPTDVESDATRRLGGEPLSRIYGEREFYGRSFRIGPATLDPRPDTETLIDAVLRTFHVKQNPQKTAKNSMRILDLGTGSGCIALTLLLEIPESVALGVDITPQTLEIFMENARLHHLNDPETGLGRAMAVCGHWGDAISGDFDLVVSNPPYIVESVIPHLDENVQKYDPILALTGGPDGLQAYRAIFLDLPRLLKPTGRAYLEIGFDQADSVSRLAGESGFFVNDIHRDLGGQSRVVEMSRGDK